jgi:hypothetical protein
MVRMKAMRSANMGDGATKVKRGTEFDVADRRRADELEKHGLAHEVKMIVEPYFNKMEPRPENKASDEGPLDLAGGETGEDASPPSSEEDLPVRRPASGRSPVRRSKSSQ